MSIGVEIPRRSTGSMNQTENDPETEYAIVCLLRDSSLKGRHVQNIDVQYATVV
jgi:hypothetical protein